MVADPPARERRTHGPYLGPPIAVVFAVALWLLLFGGILWRVTRPDG